MYSALLEELTPRHAGSSPHQGLFSGRSHSAPLPADFGSPVRDLPEVARLFGDDWGFVCAGIANVWLYGRPDMTAASLDALRPYFTSPIVTLRAPAIALPPVDQRGTVVVRDAAALTLADQDRLLEWLGRNGGRARVVAASSGAALSMMARGTFRAGLYYRLNTIYVDLTDGLK